MAIERTLSYNSEIRRLNSIDPTLGQARKQQVQSKAKAQGPSADEAAIMAQVPVARADAFDHARKGDKKQIDKVLGQLLPFLKKNSIATDVVADRLYKLVNIHTDGELGSTARHDRLNALQKEVKDVEKQLKRSNLSGTPWDPNLMDERIATWESNHQDAAGHAVAKFIHTLANNEQRVTQFEVGAGVFPCASGYLSAGTTRSAWGDNRVTLGVTGTLGIVAGVTLEIERVCATIQNRERSISSAIQNSTYFYNFVPGIMFWKKRGKDASQANAGSTYNKYGNERPSTARLSFGVSFGNGEFRRRGKSVPIFPLPSTYKGAREALGITYNESMLSEEFLVGRIPVYTNPETPVWVTEARGKAPVYNRPATPEMEETASIARSNAVVFAGSMRKPETASIASRRPLTTLSNSFVSVSSMRKAEVPAGESSSLQVPEAPTEPFAGSSKVLEAASESLNSSAQSIVFPEVPEHLPTYEEVAESSAMGAERNERKEKGQLIAE